MKIDSDVEIIGNPNLFQNYSVLNPPALIINGKIVVEGYVPLLKDMIEIIEKY